MRYYYSQVTHFIKPLIIQSKNWSCGISSERETASLGQRSGSVVERARHEVNRSLVRLRLCVYVFARRVRFIYLYYLRVLSIDGYSINYRIVSLF